MCSSLAKVLFACVAQAHVQEWVSNQIIDAQGSGDKSAEMSSKPMCGPVDRMIAQIVDRLIGDLLKRALIARAHPTDLEDVMNAKRKVNRPNGTDHNRSGTLQHKAENKNSTKEETLPQYLASQASPAPVTPTPLQPTTPPRAIVPNNDRLTCLRQDDLDLVFPPSTFNENVVRAIVPLSQGDRTRDLFISVRQLQIKNLSAIMKLRRIGDDFFGFEVVGARDDAEASIDFWLSGFEVLTRSKAIDWAARLMAIANAIHRDDLRKGQAGQLQFKLSGKTRAKLNQTTREWNLELVETKADPFKFQITQQWILERYLTRYGGIDQVLLNQVVWPVVKMALPLSLAASFQFVPLTELGLTAEVALSGSMVKPNAPLDLKIEAEGALDAKPTKVLEVFMKHFKLRDFAARRVNALLSNEELKESWQQNRQMFLKTMESYGWVRQGDALRDMIEKATELESLRPRLMEIATNSADGLTVALQPFIDAHAHGKHALFHGLQVGIAGSVLWNRSDGGLVSASLQASPTSSTFSDRQRKRKDNDAWKNFMVIPKNFLEAFFSPEESGLAASRTDSELEFKNFWLGSGNAKLSRIRFHDVFIDVGPKESAREETCTARVMATDEASHMQTALSCNQTVGKPVWRVDGDATDFSLSLPQSWDFGFNLKAQEGRISRSSQGDVSFAFGPTGILYRQLPKAKIEKKHSPVRLRKGPKESLDGALPFEFSRPAQPRAVLNRMTVVPAIAAHTNFKLFSEDDSLQAKVAASAIATIDVSYAMRSLFASRSSADFGYVYMSDTFERRVLGGEEKVQGVSNVTAIVSCGYLRLLSFDSPDYGIERLDMRPKKGQLELDITKYKTPPEVTRPQPGKACLSVYSSGHKFRKRWLGRSEVGEELCGDTDKVERLANAISLQIERFRDPRAKDWNYGTHLANTSQYEMPKDGVLISLISTSDGGELISKRSRRNRLRRDRAEIMKLRKRSESKRKCMAADKLDETIYPPENYGDNAIRMAIPLPRVGNLFLVLDKIEITTIDLEVKLRRINDRTFSLEVNGMANMWIEGLDVRLPKMPIDRIAKFAASIETGARQMLTRQPGYKGRLDKGPVDIHLAMESNFTTDNEGRWLKILGNSNQDVKINFGEGGVMAFIVNYIVENHGGVDKIFANLIWPVVMQLIPQALGQAFLQVPFKSGQISHVLRIHGVCEMPEGRKCPAQELRLHFTDSTEVRMQSAPIIADLASKKSTRVNTLQSIIDNLKEAYKRREGVFNGARIAASVEADLSLEHRLDLQASMSTRLPMGLLASLTGRDSPLLNFIPREQNLTAAGMLDMSKGVLKIPQVRLRNVRLPIVLAQGGDSIQFSANLGPVSAQLVDKSNDLSDIEIHAPEYAINASQAGITASFSTNSKSAKTVRIRIEPPLMNRRLLEATAFTTKPANTRTGPEEHADGKIPLRFRRRFSRKPAQLKLPDIIKLASFSFKLEGSPSNNLIARINANATIKIGHQFWRGLTDAKDEDFGYVHYRLVGRVGPLKTCIAQCRRKLPTTKAFVKLGCGNLEVYKVRSKDEEPYQYRYARIDLRISPQVGNVVVMVHNHSCIKIPRSGVLKWYSINRYINDEYSFINPFESSYFCAAPAAMSELIEGLQLQKKRFEHIQTCILEELEVNASKKTLKKESHDGTWFKELKVYNLSTYYPGRIPPSTSEEIQSPRAAWKALLSGG